MATKGKNSSTTKNKKSQTNTKAQKSSTKSKSKSTKHENVDDLDELFFKDSSKEIILWISIALCILLIISNFGLGGVVGNNIANFLFGSFGMIQYILPIFAAFSAFFLISNYGNKIAIAKIIAGYILLLFIGVFVELILHGASILGALGSFEYSKLNHTGGGYLGGWIVQVLYDSFGLFGAYLIDIITIVVCIIIIIERFAYNKVRNSSRRHSDIAAAQRRERRERQLLEREANETRFNEHRQSILDKIANDKEQERIELEQIEGPRRNRKHTGITTNTMINPSFDSTEVANNDVNEIRFNIGDSSIEIKETKRHKLSSNKKTKSLINSLNNENQIVDNDTQDITYENEKSVNPVINMPKTHQLSKDDLMNDNLAIQVDEEKSIHKHSKASVSSEKEIEAESESLRKTITNTESISNKPYKFPPLSLLNDPKKGNGDSKQYLNDMATRLQSTLKNFGVEAEVKEVTLGPSVTQYKISIDSGTKVSKVLSLTDDIKLNLAVTDVRIEAPIPGEPYIGIEVPNKEKTMVGFKELVSSQEFKTSKSKISFCVGKDINGKVIVGNIEKMPHLLIAGATGSGKSVCINTIIMSILYHAKPDEVKLIMVDPKMVELSVYNGIPHLLIPVVTDAKKAAGALHWAVKEMTDRYELLATAGVRNIENFNEKVEQETLPDSIPENKRIKMPQIVIILDELADLMMVAAADVEDSIVRLAQLARAAGIHLIIATQRPTSNVITGLIKANVPSRIAFSVSSSVDSRVILDMNGAEDLLGNGDMLYAPQNLSKPVRIQGAFVSDDEVANVVNFLSANNDNSSYSTEIEEVIQKADIANGSVQISGEVDNSLDALFVEAGKLVIESQKGSIGYLQRNFRIGFNRAARIMDQLCEKGVVGPEMGTKPREIRMSITEFDELISQL